MKDENLLCKISWLFLSFTFSLLFVCIIFVFLFLLSFGSQPFLFHVRLFHRIESWLCSFASLRGPACPTLPWTPVIPPCWSHSHIRLFETPWTVIHLAPLSMGFSRQEYWSGLPFNSIGNLLDSGIKPGLLHCRQILCHLNYQRSPMDHLYSPIIWLGKPFSDSASVLKWACRLL